MLHTIFSILLAQSLSNNSCTPDPQFHAFDFWIGDWVVYDQNSGKVAGYNKVSQIESGCALEEKWQSVGGGTGSSLNIFNPLTQQWRQLWIAQAYLIDISGGIGENGAMVLEGEISYYQTHQKAPFKGRWTPLPDGSIRQYFQQYDEKTQSWKDWFNGLYQRQSEVEKSTP